MYNLRSWLLTDPNGYDVAQGLASTTLERAGSHAVREIFDLIQHGVDVYDHVFAVHQEVLFRPTRKSSANE